jgi:hypothetical protein
MTGIETAAAAVCLAIALGAVLHGPKFIALGVLALLCHVTGQQARNALEALVATREVPADRWAPTSKADRRLLDRSLRIAMRRTEMRSLLPADFR